jgi:hypothetical protein
MNSVNQDYTFVELRELFKKAYRAPCSERRANAKRMVTQRFNFISRRGGIILPNNETEGLITKITTTPPQFGIDEEHKYLCSSQINTYEFGGGK